ncbi:hypothetical protein F2P81_007720 [Scophthalmus maximus]|uniref:Uncharacterized protein n=1 Tax=Scophthalmus maximus TaxID=52904 RepID=A0A6A4T300_SCOMX|nr:hypothetical protein F2P81_007720 [Scophthalmus maximus]
MQKHAAQMPFALYIFSTLQPSVRRQKGKSRKSGAVIELVMIARRCFEEHPHYLHDNRETRCLWSSNEVPEERP